MMDNYIDTEKYTLVPYAYHSTGKERELLSSLFYLGDEDVKAIDVPFLSAAMVYACGAGEEDCVPASLWLLEHLDNVPESHKVAVRFSEGLVTVALAEREHLLLLCSYRVSSFTDSLYYLFACLKEVLFEPDHTALYWCGDIRNADEALLSNYFLKNIKMDF